MPLNVSAVPPSEEVTGTTQLPLARVKKILAVDDDISGVSANAAFAITIATEMFIRYFAEQAMTVVKSERKPRKALQYRDLATAVIRVDNLNFLDDIVPRTTTAREFKARKARTAVQENAAALQNGQTTLDGSSRPIAQRPVSQAGQTAIPPEAMDTLPSEPQEAPTQMQRHVNQPQGPGNQQFIFEHYEPNGSAQRETPSDMEMEM